MGYGERTPIEVISGDGAWTAVSEHIIPKDVALRRALPKEDLHAIVAEMIHLDTFRPVMLSALEGSGVLGGELVIVTVTVYRRPDEEEVAN